MKVHITATRSGLTGALLVAESGPVALRQELKFALRSAPTAVGLREPFAVQLSPDALLVYYYVQALECLGEKERTAENRYLPLPAFLTRSSRSWTSGPH